MSRLGLTVVLLLGLLFGGAASAQIYTAALLGTNEVQAGDPDGFGSASIQISGTQVNYLIVVTNIVPPTMQHIHVGAAGVNGPVVINLPGPWVGNTLQGTTTTSDAQASAILANPAGFYVNVHNAEFPGGAVRGQMFRSGDNTLSVPSTSTVGMLALAVVLMFAGVLALRRR